MKCCQITFHMAVSFVSSSIQPMYRSVSISVSSLKLGTISVKKVTMMMSQLRISSSHKKVGESMKDSSLAPSMGARFCWYLDFVLKASRTVTINFCCFKPLCCCCLVAKSCPTLCEHMDCSLPGSSVHGISQARTLEWVAISFSGGAFWLRDLMCLMLGRWILYHWMTWEALFKPPRICVNSLWQP